MLEKYKQQLYDVNKINSNQMIGMFNLKFHLLKNVARPTCNLLLELVEETLVKYVKKVKKLFDRLVIFKN